MKIAVIGADGQLGTDICEALDKNKDEVTGLTVEHIEVTDIDSVSNVLKGAGPEVVINTAAFHDLERCV
jgi:dTDP-4-dehydrorhamnose reductase